MRTILVAILCLSVPALAEKEENNFKIVYDGGSISDLKTGKPLKLFLQGGEIKVMKDGAKKGDAPLLVLPPSSVLEISYGQDVHRRVGAAIGLAVVSFGIGALMALSKSKKHYIGLTWDNAGQKGGIAFQASKTDYRGLLAGLEGITGKKAVNSDTATVKN